MFGGVGRAGQDTASGERGSGKGGRRLSFDTPSLYIVLSFEDKR